MAEGTYEYECMRAELLGNEKPNQEVFERAREERIKREQEEKDAAEAVLLEEQEEVLNSSGGKLDELNIILSSTQQKLNRFKQTACGSLSNIFGRGSVDMGDTTANSSVATNRVDAFNSKDPNAKQLCEDINNTSESLDEPQDQTNRNADIKPIIPTETIRSAKEMEKKMTSHLDKLDLLINKAENAELSMSVQTKQMRKMAK